MKKPRLNSQGYLMVGKKDCIHRLVWEACNGPIPKGFHIHHKDGNKLNNSIDNLECISHSDHLRLHMTSSSEKLHAWHKSPEGRKFLGEKSKKLWKIRKVHELDCKHCGAKFKAIQIDRAQYCSVKCQNAAREAKKPYHEERSCVICSKPFFVRKWYKTKTCGYACGDRLRRKDFGS